MDEAPGYEEMITRPMDLATVKVGYSDESQ